MKWLILILGICTNAFASVLIKIAVTEPRRFPSFTDIGSALANWPFWLGLFFYGAAFLLYTAALSKFPLNIAHPVITTGAVALVALLSMVIFKEQFYWTTVLGIFLVIIGVGLITVRDI
jgi:small multidrug resistance pump